MLFDAMDLAATFVFAISGATRGVRQRLDLFGVLVVAWVAGVAGGIARDLLIGAVPPAAIADWRYLAVAVAAGLLGFFASDLIARLRTPVLLFDAAGPLPVRRHRHRRRPWPTGSIPLMAAMLGMITCIGGGVARDLLTLAGPDRAALRTLCRGRPGRAPARSPWASGSACPSCPTALFGRRPLPLPAADVDLPRLATARRR